ncbi:MAG: hypothetical protein EHM24_24945 [Acidobacteria bacterium]|nr:MAG: hypothetical protein EHM24_24945 [Acidobacteriota bacterium]
MRRIEPDNRATPDANERLDRLVDEALREVSAQSPPATVKARVMAAWDERHAADAAASRASSWWSVPALLRPAAALAGSLVIVLGVFLAWQHVNRQFDAVDRHRPSSTTARTQPPSGSPLPPPVQQQVEGGGAAQEAQPAASPGRRRSRFVTVEWPVEQVAELGPHLPGAPAGELGDPIAPMPRPPTIAIAPIETAPLVSEFARPVTEFPADNQPPAGEGAEAGKSGGLRR